MKKGTEETMEKTNEKLSQENSKISRTTCYKVYEEHRKEQSKNEEFLKVRKDFCREK